MQTTQPNLPEIPSNSFLPPCLLSHAKSDLNPYFIYYEHSTDVINTCLPSFLHIYVCKETMITSLIYNIFLKSSIVRYICYVSKSKLQDIKCPCELVLINFPIPAFASTPGHMSVLCFNYTK